MLIKCAVPNNENSVAELDLNSKWKITLKTKSRLSQDDEDDLDDHDDEVDDGYVFEEEDVFKYDYYIYLKENDKESLLYTTEGLSNSDFKRDAEIFKYMNAPSIITQWINQNSKLDSLDISEIIVWMWQQVPQLASLRAMELLKRDPNIEVRG